MKIGVVSGLHRTASLSRSLLDLSGRWRNSSHAHAFRRFVREIEGKSCGRDKPPAFEYVLAAVSSRLASGYVSLHDWPFAHLPWAVWTRGCGNCLGSGLLIRWICDLLHIKSEGILVGTHYLLRVSEGRRVRYLDRVKHGHDDSSSVFTRRLLRGVRIRPITVVEEIALLLQAQSCVTLGHFGRGEAAIIEAELAYGLAPTMPLIHRHYDRVKSAAEPRS
jgi:hypothetical protein